MELCFNEMTVMKNGTLPEDIALCAQAGFSAVELRKGTLLRYLRGGGTLEALRQTLALDDETLFQKGMQAREFVLKQRNNVIQAKKVLDMLEGEKKK